jgi:hypothetical protein
MTSKKTRPANLLVALAASLIILTAAGPLWAVTLYYAPVVSSAGDRVAYVKRTYRYWASGGSIIPFLGGKPTKVRVLSDRIQLCIEDLKTGRVRVVEEWKPKQVKESGRLHIKPILNWELETLRYVISIRTDNDPGIGIFRRPYAYLTNLEKWGGLKPGPTEAGIVRVRLNAKPTGRFPDGNDVVIEHTWDRKTALPLIRRDVDELIASQVASARDPLLQRKIQNLSEFVAGQTAGQLPDEMVTLFLNESNNGSGTYPDLSPFVVELGEAAIEPLLQRYGRSPANTRLAILTVFGDIGSATAMTRVRREIREGTTDVQRAAVVALRKIKGDRAGEELVLLLANTRLPPSVRVTVLSQLTQTPGSDWPVHVLDAALEDPVVFGQLTDVVPDISLFPEREIWFRLSRIYPYLESENPGDVKTAQHLIARIRFWNHLSKLGPVVEDLLKARYDYGRTTDTSGNVIDMGKAPTDDRVVWDGDLAADMLKNIEENMPYPTQWMRGNIKYPENLLTQLYLEELLYIRKGQRIINRPPVEAQLELSVADHTGSLLAVGRRFAEVGSQVVLQGDPVAAGLTQSSCSGRLDIDKTRWRLTFDPMVLQFEGRKMTGPVSIPFGGACVIRIGDGSRGSGKSYTVKIRHIDAPRPRETHKRKSAQSGNRQYGDVNASPRP